MRRIQKMVLLLLCVVGFMTACGKSAEAMWQEKYDLGQRYLQEGDYEEAIVVFTEAIEIDPNRAEGYLGRANAYLQSKDAERNLVLSRNDYEKALSLDDSLAEAYKGLAEVYIQQGDLESAIEWLETGYEKTGDESIQKKLSECILKLTEEQEEASRDKGEESQIQEENKRKKGTKDELTDKMRLLADAGSDDIGPLEGLELIEYYPDKETYLMRMETWAGKGPYIPYSIIDNHGNVLLSGYEGCIGRVKNGYFKTAYYEKGTLKEASWELLDELLYDGENTPVDVYIELYDWSGNFIERRDSYSSTDEGYSLKYNWSGNYVEREDSYYLNMDEDYSLKWEELGETFRSGDYSASEDTLDIEHVEDGFIVCSRSGEELGYIKIPASDSLQPIVMGNVLGLWEAGGYGCVRYYWVDIEE